MVESLKTMLSDMQGKIFEMSRVKGYDSESFISAFMTSQIADDLDADFNHMQWAGKEYVMDRIERELKEKLIKGGEVYDTETLYWTGYVYRQWHYYTGETSKDIYKQAKAKRMRSIYYPYHTMSVEMAIDRIKEANLEKKKK